MGFTVRFILGTVLVLLCSWSIETTSSNRPVRQVSHNGNDQTNEKLQEAQAKNATQSVVANLTEDGSSKPKTDFSTEHNKTIDKQNSVVGKLQKSESYKKGSPQAESARSIDIEKYVSKDFHNKNNVYTLPASPDTEKYIDADFNFHATTHKGSDFSDFNFESELTTPKSTLFDQRYKEAVESVEQKLEHIDDSHELSSESESKENINLDKLYEETQKNDTKADLDYVNYKNIVSNDTGTKNSLHKDLLVEAGTNLHFRSSYNHTTIIDEDDDGNNTIVKDPNDVKKMEISTLSNLIPAKGDLDNAESSTSKTIILTTRKSFTFTKPPSNKNSSHISILSNNIETETIKAVNPVITTTERVTKGETEVVLKSFSRGTPIEVVKRLFTFNDVPRTEPTLDTNHINKKSEQLLQENQVIPVHVEPPPAMRNVTTEATLPSEDRHTVMKLPSKNVTLTPEAISSKEENTNSSVSTLEPPKVTSTSQEISTTTEIKIIPVSESSTEPVIASTSENEPAWTTKHEQTTLSSKVETTVSSSNLEETPISFPETTTVLSSTQGITISTSQPELTTMSISDPEITTLSLKSETFRPETTTVLPTKFEETINATKQTEVETITSIVTETSISPWEKVTVQATNVESRTTSSPQYTTESSTVVEAEVTTVATETSTLFEEAEGTTLVSTYLSDSTAATTTETTESPVTTMKEELTTESAYPKNSKPDTEISTMTTEETVRTSKAMIYKNITTPYASTTPEITTVVNTVQLPETTTVLETTTDTVTETLEQSTKATKIEELKLTPVSPEFKHIEPTYPSVDLENTTEQNEITSDFFELSSNNTEPPEDNSGTIAAITISSIGAVCLILLAGLLVIMRKRQKRFNYGQRCTPVSLDDYSMDNVSVYNSMRTKGMLRGSKRSYGNPAFEDPVCVSHPLNFPALGKFANNLEDIKAEFEEIPQITARTNELPEGCDTKNRYANVIPLPETRVFLSLIDGYPNSDYINANYVTGPKNTKGYYIACQAPLQNTVDDFWRMIWEQQCKVMLMMTHLFENGVEKCVDYLPPSEVLDCHRLFGDFQVTLKKREVKDKYIISSLQLKNMVSNSWREVTHFWYLGWPEKGVPLEANSLIAFLIEARSYMKSSSLDRKDVTNGNLTNGMPKNELNPVVVHCSPGTGRTGVVIACDIAIREFEQTRLVDVPRIVYKIRRDRASAVQTKEQYAFIYKVINLYATKLTGGALDSL